MEHIEEILMMFKPFYKITFPNGKYIVSEKGVSKVLESEELSKIEMYHTFILHKLNQGA